ncbi:hypothetical protein OpiT1DRAFT_03529 [Opitutaceae bacterium TAV1]|nr:hypothetical protein OpiT1DRAFT_03529 [Opitutaceae bacterium TAV1]
MNKAYFLAPILAILAFGGFYWNFRSGYEEREVAKQAAIRAEKEESLKVEAEARRKAIEEAVALQEQRKKERAEKEAAEQAAKEARQLALDERDKAYSAMQQSERRLEQLKKELATVQADIAAIKTVHETATAEEDFLKTYVEKVRTNQRALEGVISKILPGGLTAPAPAGS